MAVPVVVVGGFLGAGKTSLINRIVNRCAPLRLSVLVNDFGALAIDSDLIEQAGERIVTLKNGCVCCSLQGDLLASIRMVLSRPDPPDAVLVECSGVSRIGAVRDALLDPVIWQAAALEAVVCVADAADMAADEGYFDDPLRAAPIRDADLVVLSKTDLLSGAVLERVLAALHARKRADLVLRPADAADLPGLLLAAAPGHAPATAPRQGARFRAEDGADASSLFASVSWRSARALDFGAFQAAIQRHAATILRAKGILRLHGRETAPLLFQMVGQRVTVGPAPARAAGADGTRLVFIGRRGRIDCAAIAADMDGCVPPGTAGEA